MKIAIGFVFASSLYAFTAHAAPEGSGSLESAKDYVAACRAVIDAPDAVVNAGTESEKIHFALVSQYCYGLVSTVARTIVTADNYTVSGRRICVDESRTMDDVLRDVIKTSETSEFQALDLATNDLIVATLGRASRCKE